MTSLASSTFLRTQFASCGDDPYSELMNIAGSYSVLNVDQEIELGRQIRDGREADEQLRKIAAGEEPEQSSVALRRLRRRSRAGQDAHDLMVLSNLRLVATAVRKFTSRVSHMDQLDMMQDGIEGLIKAARAYDPERGRDSKFSTCAMPWILQQIKRGIDRQDKAIYIPGAQVDMANQVRYTITDLTNRTKDQIAPTDEQVGNHLGISADRVAILRSMPTVYRSLDEPAVDDASGARTLGDQFAGDTGDPADQVDDMQMQWQLEQIIRYLSESDRRVLRSLWGIDGTGVVRTCKEVARQFGLQMIYVQELERDCVRRYREDALQGVSA